jgi:hypothetical protein
VGINKKETDIKVKKRELEQKNGEREVWVGALFINA